MQSHKQELTWTEAPLKHLLTQYSDGNPRGCPFIARIFFTQRTQMDYRKHETRHGFSIPRRLQRGFFLAQTSVV